MDVHGTCPSRVMAAHDVPATPEAPRATGPPPLRRGQGGSPTSVASATLRTALDAAPPTTASLPTSPPPLRRGGRGVAHFSRHRHACAPRKTKARQQPQACPQALPPLPRGGRGVAHSVDTATRAHRARRKRNNRKPAHKPSPAYEGGQGGSPTSVDTATRALHVGRSQAHPQRMGKSKSKSKSKSE